MIGPLAKSTGAILEKRSTLEFPEERQALPDSYRGKLRLDMSTCISCRACERICPNKTITMVDVMTDKGKKVMPQIGLERCLFCALCEEVCPPKCLTLSKDVSFNEVEDKRSLLKRPEELE